MAANGGAGTGPSGGAGTGPSGPGGTSPRPSRLRVEGIPIPSLAESYFGAERLTIQAREDRMPHMADNIIRQHRAVRVVTAVAR